MNRRLVLVVTVGLAVLLFGCNPTKTVAKLGMHLVGDFVEDQETQKLGRQLIGQPPAAADGVLGERVDVLRTVNGADEWLVYPVKLDLLGKKRYVVGVSGGRIVDVKLVERGGGKVGIPQKLIYEAKVKGKPPEECERALGLGPPMLTVRSATTGQLRQLYRAKTLSTPTYCILRYGDDNLCTELDLVEVAATSQ
ncbi:MAG: hypothetical protein AB1716_10820 [Planctomycetota bacterium]